MKRFLCSVAVIFCAVFIASAQQSPEQFVKSQYPQLMSIFEKDMNNVHCTYIFAVDVSGSMKTQWASTVEPALAEFMGVLPDGDFVNVIRFGNDAKENSLGYVGKVGDIRQTLISKVSGLYSDPNDNDIRSLTNVPKAISAVSEALASSESDINFVFLLTDYKNEEDRSGGNLMSKKTMESLRSRLEQVTSGKNGRVVLLKLPIKPGNEKGVVIDQSKELFSGLDLSSEVQDILDGGSLKNWFNMLRRDVMVNKLRAVVEKENRVANMEFKPEINIDGKVVTSLTWAPNRLFTKVKVDSTSMVPVAGKSLKYYFVNNRKAFVETEKTSLRNIKLGRIKSNSFFGFGPCRDSVLYGVTLPTPYDAELSLLRVEKPVPSVSMPVDRWIFTFFLPFWLCVLILALLIIYIILVISAMGRNSKKKFKVRKITVSDDQGNVLAEKSFGGKSMDTFTVPGTITVPGPGLPGTLTFYKKKGNPFVFGKPKLKVKSSCPMKGASGSEMPFKTNNPIYIGKVKGVWTHKVNVQQ